MFNDIRYSLHLFSSVNAESFLSPLSGVLICVYCFILIKFMYGFLLLALNLS